MTYANTLPGYEVEAAEVIPDDEDPGVGFAAGDRVRINEEDEMFPDEEGIVQCVARGRGFFEGQIIVDVLVEGTDEAHRLPASAVEAS